MKALDSCTEWEARDLIGHAVEDDKGQQVGFIKEIWFDLSTHQPDFMGFRGERFRWGLFRDFHFVPAIDVTLDESRGIVRLSHSAEFLKGGPRSNPTAGLSEVQREEINAYYGRSMSLRRVTAIEAVRPEEAIPPSELPCRGPEDRAQIERQEQAFFNQEGFVTDAMPSANAAEELERFTRESKIRQAEYREREGGP